MDDKIESFVETTGARIVWDDCYGYVGCPSCIFSKHCPICGGRDRAIFPLTEFFSHGRLFPE